MSTQTTNVTRTKSQVFFRWFFYVLGFCILALGIIFNTKCGMGVSPIISVPYTIAIIGGFNFGNASLVAYVVLALIEFALKGRNLRAYDWLQIPLSIAFTRLFNVFGALLPTPTTLPGQLVCLALGIACTGIGAAMNVGARLVPNPGDGIVQAISDRAGKPLGLCKNCFDVTCVAFAIAVGYLATGGLVGAGVGTICAVIGVGRFIALYNHLFSEKTMRLSGMMPAEA